MSLIHGAGHYTVPRGHNKLLASEQTLCEPSKMTISPHINKEVATRVQRDNVHGEEREPLTDPVKSPLNTGHVL